MNRFLCKMKGGGQCPPAADRAEVFWSWLGAFLGIAAVALLHFAWFDGQELVFIIGSFGASAVLIYGAVNSPLAQPRNLVGGHVFSALIGVACRLALPGELWLAAPLAVATAIAAMQLTSTLHPPGGATALIAVIGGPRIAELGFWYVLAPVASGSLLMLAVAMVVNNIPSRRRYPLFWF